MTAPLKPSEAAQELAIRFHETYERLAPSFGYETRTDTRTFDPESKNGRLMVAVCGELLPSLASDSTPERCKHGVWAADRCEKCEAESGQTAVAPVVAAATAQALRSPPQPAGDDARDAASTWAYKKLYDFALDMSEGGSDVAQLAGELLNGLSPPTWSEDAAPIITDAERFRFLLKRGWPMSIDGARTDDDVRAAIDAALARGAATSPPRTPNTSPPP